MLWQRNLEKDYQVAFAPGTPSPLIEGDLLILFIGGKPDACVVALNKDTGKETWKALDESLTFSSPIVITSGGKRQLIVWTQESVTSLDPATGQTWWRQRLLTSSDYAVSTPVFHKDRLLIGGLMFELDADKPAATVLWPASKAPARRIFSHTSTALFRGDHLFSAKSSGELICVEASTGKQVWEVDQGDRPEKWGEHPPDSERRFRIALHGQRGADSGPAHFPGLPGDQPRRRAGTNDAIRGEERRLVGPGICQPPHLRPQRQRADLRLLGDGALMGERYSRRPTDQ